VFSTASRLALRLVAWTPCCRGGSVKAGAALGRKNVHSKVPGVVSLLSIVVGDFIAIRRQKSSKNGFRRRPTSTPKSRWQTAKTTSKKHAKMIDFEARSEWGEAIRGGGDHLLLSA